MGGRAAGQEFETPDLQLHWLPVQNQKLLLLIYKASPSHISLTLSTPIPSTTLLDSLTRTKHQPWEIEPSPLLPQPSGIPSHKISEIPVHY